MSTAIYNLPHELEYEQYFSACERANKHPLSYAEWLAREYPNETLKG